MQKKSAWKDKKTARLSLNIAKKNKKKSKIAMITFCRFVRLEVWNRITARTVKISLWNEKNYLFYYIFLKNPKSSWTKYTNVESLEQNLYYECVKIAT